MVAESVAVSDENFENIPIFDRDVESRLKIRETVMEHEKLILSGCITKGGTFNFLDTHLSLREFASQPFFLEIENAIPRRIYFPEVGEDREFLPIVDNHNGEIIDIHLGTITRRRFGQFRDVTILTRLDSRGVLALGGKPPKVGPNRSNYWANFWGHGDELVEVRVQNGLVTNVTSLESNLNTEFAKVWDRKREAYVATFNGKIPARNFDSLDESVEIHDIQLSKYGRLELGGRIRMNVGNSFAKQRVDIVDIRNPTGKEAVVVSVRTQDGYIKTLPQIYSLDGSPNSFKKGRLLKVYEKWSAGLAAELNEQPSYIVSGIRLTKDGRINHGGYYVAKIPRFGGAEIEMVVVDRAPQLIRFLKNSAGEAILDSKGQPFTIEVTQSIHDRLKDELKRLFPRERFHAEEIMILASEEDNLYSIADETQLTSRRVEQCIKSILVKFRFSNKGDNFHRTGYQVSTIQQARALLVKELGI